MKEETPKQFIQVFIKTEADLPEENGKYICMIKNINHPALLQYDIQSKGESGYSKQWLELVDWYLKSTEPVSDEDMYLNMQYYMEYCQSKGYVTPQEWLNKHKHFKL